VSLARVGATHWTLLRAASGAGDLVYAARMIRIFRQRRYGLYLFLTGISARVLVDVWDRRYSSSHDMTVDQLIAHQHTVDRLGLITIGVAGAGIVVGLIRWVRRGERPSDAEVARFSREPQPQVRDAPPAPRKPVAKTRRKR
jgi:hypothetical protein